MQKKNVATTVHGFISGCKEYNHKYKTEKSVYLVFDQKCQYVATNSIEMDKNSLSSNSDIQVYKFSSTIQIHKFT